jgi:hypothetical protein
MDQGDIISASAWRNIGVLVFYCTVGSGYSGYTYAYYIPLKVIVGWYGEKAYQVGMRLSKSK